MSGRRGGFGERPAPTPARARAGRARGARPSRIRPSVVALVVLLIVAGGPGPGLLAAGPPIAAAQDAPSSVPTPTAAEQRRAAGLRKVAQDALAERGDDDELDLDDSLLGVGGVVWRILLVVLVVVAILVAISLYRRGPRRRRRGSAAPEVDRDEAAALEQEARRAEDRGEHRAAVVLWFRAGAHRLAERRRVRADGTATAGQVARESGDPRVGELAVAHDRAAYGPGPVGPDASRGAREGWAVVLRDPAPAVGAGRSAGPGGRSAPGGSAGPRGSAGSAAAGEDRR